LSKKATTGARELEAAKRTVARAHHELVLYIAGSTPQSMAALSTIVALCKERLLGRYTLRVVDVYVDPKQARRDDVIVVPTLLKKRPLPQRRLVGDLSDRTQLLRGLGLSPSAKDDEKEAL